MSDTKCQVAYCNCGCGALVYAHVLPSRAQDELIKDVSDLLRDGCEVTTMTVGEFKAHPDGFMCKHERPVAQEES